MSHDAGDNSVIPEHPVPRGRGVAVVGTAVFLVLLFVPGVFHLMYGVRGSDWRRWGEWLRERPAGEAVRAIDGDFDRRFLLRFAAVALTEQTPVLKGKIYGGEITEGKDGFLFSDEDTQVCTAAGFLHPRFPRPGEALGRIVEFDKQLKARGVHLLVVPVPAKATLYPDRLDPKYEVSRGPLVNVDQGRWFEKLREAGVDALDVTPALWAHREDDGKLVCYPADTHWTDYGKRVAAGVIAEHLKEVTAGMPRARGYRTRVTSVNVEGNMVEPGLRAAPRAYREEVVELYDEEGKYRPGVEAPVMLIGDSQAELGVAAGHGLAQRLTEAMGVDVESAAVAGATPNQMRRVVNRDARELRAGRVVVWVFSIRHLLIHEWGEVKVGE